MRTVQRPAEPDVVARLSTRWRTSYLTKLGKKSDARPPSGTYDHDEIKRALKIGGGYKCFYCERALTDSEVEIDHRLPLADAVNPEERAARAFDWTNLYVSCKGCNGAKKGRPDIAITTCLDPCSKDQDPAEHLTFVNEKIHPRRESMLGKHTIDKFDLGRENLCYARAVAIQEFYQKLISIQAFAVREKRSVLPAELDILRAFADETRAFSSMFRNMMRELSIL